MSRKAGKSDEDSGSSALLLRAVEVWRRIAGGDRSIDARLLAGGRHATAVHLQAEDHTAPSVVAKIRPRGGLDLERLIHEAILPELGVATPEYLGFAAAPDGENDFLFLEYVGATEFDSSVPAHQAAAGSWLGQCHAASARVSIAELVPRRSLDEEWAGLAEIRLRLSATLANPALGAEGLLVARVLEQLDTATQRWPQWAERSAAVPGVLTHGAFITRNVRMRDIGRSLTTLPFDWDHVAVRSPAVDLARSPRSNRGFAANVSLPHYQAALVADGLPLDRTTVDSLVTLGTIIRAATCIGWLIPSLASDYVDQAVAELALYSEALADALGE